MSTISIPPSQRSPGNPSCIGRWWSPYCIRNQFDHELPRVQYYDRIAFLNEIRSCRKEKNIQKTNRIYAEVLENQLVTKDVYIATALISAFANCGSLEKAQEVFEQIPVHNVVSWNALISGYVQQGLGNEALTWFRHMQDAAVCPDSITYINVLKACGIVGSLEAGEEIVTEVRKRGLLWEDVVLGNALVDMYLKCDALGKAEEVFAQLPIRDVVTWSTLISGYVQQGFGNEALKSFKDMVNAGVIPNAVTYVCVMKACGIVGSLEIGEGIYAEVRKQGLLHKEVTLGNALVHMYFTCGALEKARETFEQLPLRNVVTWSSMISGYIQYGLGDEALKCFQEMQDAGIRPDVITYVCVLKACSIKRCLQVGERVDAELRERGLLNKNVVLGTSLVDMYTKCGAFEKAQKTFLQLPVQNVVSWSALISGYAQYGFGEKALKCFRQMQDAGVSPNAVTYIGVLKACGIVGSLDIGDDISMKIRKQGLLQKDVMLGSAMVDMYSKCGALEKARETFDELPMHNVVTWSALMFGHAQLGDADNVLDLYRRMKADKVVPNLVTFVVLLTACSHAGLMEVGEKLFREMHDVYSLVPTLEHYNCMIDLYGRAGHFGKVEMLLDKILDSDHLPFLTILGACRKWRNVVLGRWVFQKLLELDVKCAAAYVCMQNIYALVGMQTELEGIKVLKVMSSMEDTWMLTVD